MTLKPLSFVFLTTDPEFSSTNMIIQNNPYIGHSFVKAPIYDEETGVKIGYKVSDDYIQQVDENKFVIRISNTYLFQDGSISWQYAFENDTNSFFYPINKLAYSTITSGTGKYYGLSGSVTLYPTQDGARIVKIVFNF